MAFDGLTLAALNQEFNHLLVNGRIDKIYQPEKDEIILQIRQPGNNYKLLISANAQTPRIHITNIIKENPLSPPIFCMVLRKYLEGGRIRSFQQKGLERIMSIQIEAQDELGNYSLKTLQIEIMGKHSNIILLDTDEETILDGIKRYTYAVSSHREVLPGRKYILPPLQDKVNSFDISEERFQEHLYRQAIDIKLEKCLLSMLTGWSPQSCREIVFRAGLDEFTTLDECGIGDIQKLWQEIANINQQIASNTNQPVWYKSPGGKPVAFAPFPLHQLKEENLIANHGSINEVVNTFYTTKLSAQALNQGHQDLLKVINTYLTKAQKKITLLQEEMGEADRREIYKIKGEILTANLWQIPQGANSIRLPNFYHPEGQEINIELDPLLSANDNAQRYFKLYAKGKKQKEAALEQISITQGEINYLESVAAAIENTEKIQDLKEIRQELVEEGYLKPKFEKTSKFKTKGKKSEESLEPLKYLVGGFDVWVGKNNKQNDFITHKKASNQDLWFHVKDIPGSHVILRISQQGLTLDDLADEVVENTAQIAAHFSKARGSALVPVDYTYVKKVHKPSGGKPGMVNYFDQYTVYITPEEDTINKLIKPE